MVAIRKIIAYPESVGNLFHQSPLRVGYLLKYGQYGKKIYLRINAINDEYSFIYQEGS